MFKLFWYTKKIVEELCSQITITTFLLFPLEKLLQNFALFFNKQDIIQLEA